MRKPLIARGLTELADGRLIPRKGNMKGQVIAQVITRHFGGHEEGGWWFDAADTVAVSRRCRLHNAEQIARKMQAKLAERGIVAEGNISSVLGGQEVIFFFSDEIPEPARRPVWS